MRRCDFNKVPEQLSLITFRHEYSPVNLLHTFRTPFTRNTSGWLLLDNVKFCLLIMSDIYITLACQQ